MRVEGGGRVNEEELRAALDQRGLLVPGALPEPPQRTAFTVFAQRRDACLDLVALKHNASRFFGAKIGITVDKHYGGHAPDVDAARVVLATDDATTSGTRLAYGRRAHPADVDAAEAAERAQNTTGMAILAQRCGAVWLVVREGDDDRAALLIATIFASVMLGPILVPTGDRLLGVRSARFELEKQARPYR